MSTRKNIAAMFRRISGVSALTEQITFLVNEVSELRQIVRTLQADSPGWQDWMQQTRDSFDAQWHLMPDGVHMLSDPDFVKNMTQHVMAFTGLPETWFPGKKVLDAGCGNGRWSYALSRLGAEVTAVDQSDHGLEAARRQCAEFPSFSTIQANLLAPLPFEEGSFDLVWSFGVLHHTGNTLKGFFNISPLVKTGGRIFLMLYGEPELPGQYDEVNSYVEHRRATSSMSFEEKKFYCENLFPEGEVQAWFDAISPRINDLYRFDEIHQWLVMAGFSDITRTIDNRNLFVTGIKTR